MTARPPDAADVHFFASAAELRDWFDRHGKDTDQLWVGFHTKASGGGGVSYSEAVDEALCVGWIDGVRMKTATETYVNRFSPRTPRSSWSAVNLRRFETLRAGGRDGAEGMRVFEARSIEASGTAIGDRPANLDPASEAAFRAQPAAWAYFAAQPPAYRRDAAWWVTSAKREATRERRLATLIADSAAGRRLGVYETARARAASRKQEGR